MKFFKSIQKSLVITISIITLILLSFSPIVKPISTAQANQCDEIEVGSYPLSTTAINTNLYTTNASDNTVSVIDSTTNTVTNTINVGNHPESATVVGTHLYVLNVYDSTVSVIDTTTNTVTDTISVGGYPEFATAVGTKLYVMNSNDSSVSVIDTTTNTVTDTISVGSSITDTDAKFGNIKYYFDTVTQKWMVSMPDEQNGGMLSATVATPESTVNGMPVFRGTRRWKTVIIPLSHTTFLKINITGGGFTQPLDDLVKTVKKV